MKKIMALFVSVSCIIMSLSFCTVNKTYAEAVEETTEEETTVAPTGYPDEEVQKEYLFWDGSLYTYDVYYLTELPEDAIEIGEIGTVDDINYPDEDLEASHLVAGLRVYKDASRDYLYVESNEGYGRFSVCDDAETIPREHLLCTEDFEWGMSAPLFNEMPISSLTLKNQGVIYGKKMNLTLLFSEDGLWCISGTYDRNTSDIVSEIEKDGLYTVHETAYGENYTDWTFIYVGGEDSSDSLLCEGSRIEVREYPDGSGQFKLMLEDAEEESSSGAEE